MLIPWRVSISVLKTTLGLIAMCILTTSFWDDSFRLTLVVGVGTGIAV